jgi:hypothetical protein
VCVYIPAVRAGRLSWLRRIDPSWTGTHEPDHHHHHCIYSNAVDVYVYTTQHCMLARITSHSQLAPRRSILLLL